MYPDVLNFGVANRKKLEEIMEMAELCRIVLKNDSSW